MCQLRDELSISDVVYKKLGVEKAQKSTYKWESKKIDHLLASWKVLPIIFSVY